MPPPSAPFKTPLGQEELRHRTCGLGQRHRTVLFLVDGRRSLGDILAMARQAGAQTTHFEDLLRLGLVELPELAVPPEAIETAPGALDIPKLTSVVLDIRLDELAAERESRTETASRQEPVSSVRAVVAPPALASWVPTVQPAWPEVPETTLPPRALPALAPPPPPPPRPPAVSAPRKRRRATAPPKTPTTQNVPLLTPAPAPDWLTVRAHPIVMAPESAPDVVAQLIQDVRGLLIHALGGDAALFAPLVLNRVRAARTSRQLIGLVWEIERHRGHSRRGRPQLLSLERARDLLGMGNTLVAGDSQIGDSWPDTNPGRR